MIVIYLMLFLYLFLPVLGQLYLLVQNKSVSAGDVTPLLIFNNVFFIVIIFAVVFIFEKRKAYSGYTLKESTINPFIIFSRSKFLLFFAAVVIFLVAGYKVFFLGVNRGDVRVSLGMFGFLYNWLVIFFVPGMIFICFFAYYRCRDKLRKVELFKIVFLGALCGLLTGYKSTIILVFLPALSLVFFSKGNYFYLFLIALLGFVALIFTTAFVRGVDLYTAYDFLINRLTVMTAYGTIGVWNHYENGAGFDEASKLALGLFGNNIASSILGVSQDSVDFLSTNLSRLITYKVYPNSYGALKGTVNVTVTSFGESIYMFGKFYWIYALFAGLIISYIRNEIKRLYYEVKPTRLACFCLYFFIIILPWMNSGNVFKLISLPSIFWILLTWLVLNLICYGRFNKS